MRVFTTTIPKGKKSLEHQAAYQLLERAVQIVRGIPLPPIERDSHGKPYFPTLPDLHFNLSHCNGLAACGISSMSLGVDCEVVRPLRDGVLRRSFSSVEQQLVSQSSSPDEMFFRLWTLKESYVKALGIGISYPLHTANFALENNTVTVHPSGWQFCQFQLENGIILSCCAAITDTLPEQFLHI